VVELPPGHPSARATARYASAALGAFSVTR
jgi:hypothetical protein